jgi:carbamate kinase
MLLLLSSSQLTIEAAGVSVPAAAAAAAAGAAAGVVHQDGPSQWLEPAAQPSLSVTLQGVERLLQSWQKQQQHWQRHAHAAGVVPQQLLQARGLSSKVGFSLCCTVTS